MSIMLTSTGLPVLSASGAVASFPSNAFPEDPRGFRGWQPTRSHGTTFDYIVDAGGGGDYTTLTAAVAAASAGQSIGIRSGTYREQVTLKSGMTVSGYGTEKPEITGYDLLTGFVQCSASDSGVLGSTLGVNGSPVYKKTGILKSSLGYSELLALNPRENGVALYNAVDKFENVEPFARENVLTYYASGTVTNTTITDASVITSARYTQTELEDYARVWAYTTPNIVEVTDITAATLGSNQVTISTISAESTDMYAICNVGRYMTAGTWVYVDGGGSTFDLYVYPYDSGDIDKIEISARVSVLEIPDGNPSGITIQGLVLTGASGDSAYEGAAIANDNSASTCSDITIQNCKITHCDNVGFLQWAAISIAKTDGELIQNCSFKHIYNLCIASLGASSVHRLCTAEKLGGDFSRSNACTKHAVVRNYVTDGSWRQHANNLYSYAAGVDFLVWGNEFNEVNGYTTIQNMTGDLYMGFNFSPCFNRNRPAAGFALSNAKYVDQYSNTGNHYIFNNGFHVVTDGTATGGHLAILLAAEDGVAFVDNNVAHGIQPTDEWGTDGGNANAYNDGSCESNVITHDGNGALESDYPASNAWAQTLSAVYTDYANGDYTPTDASSPIRTTTGQNRSAWVTAAKAAFPDVPSTDLDVDFKGNTITWTDLRVGPDWVAAA